MAKKEVVIYTLVVIHSGEVIKASTSKEELEVLGPTIRTMTKIEKHLIEIEFKS